MQKENTTYDKKELAMVREMVLKILSNTKYESKNNIDNVILKNQGNIYEKATILTLSSLSDNNLLMTFIRILSTILTYEELRFLLGSICTIIRKDNQINKISSNETMRIDEMIKRLSIEELKELKLQLLLFQNNEEKSKMM